MSRLDRIKQKTDRRAGATDFFRIRDPGSDFPGLLDANLLPVGRAFLYQRAGSEQRDSQAH